MVTRLPQLLVLAVALVLSVASVGTAQTPVPLQAEISKKATLVSAEAADVEVTVTCPSGGHVQEAFVYLVQDGNTSEFEGIPVICDDQAHTFTVRVSAFPEAPFHRGKARASAFVLLEDPVTGSTESVSPTRIVKLK